MKNEKVALTVLVPAYNEKKTFLRLSLSTMRQKIRQHRLLNLLRLKRFDLLPTKQTWVKVKQFKQDL